MSSDRTPSEHRGPSHSADELSQLFRAYLSQDWNHEYDTVRDFCSGYSADAVARAADQTRQILESTDEARLASTVSRLGLEYYPPGDGSTYREWLAALEKLLRSPHAG